MHPFELACTFHIKFEKIHPFRDGNGRVGRLIMNFILLKNRFPLLDIKADKKIAYYKTLEKAQIQRKHKDFVDYAFETYKEDAKQMEWIL
jgi:Fic family protein